MDRRYSKLDSETHPMLDRLDDKGPYQLDLDHSETAPAASSRSRSCGEGFTFTRLALCVSLFLNLLLLMPGLGDWLSLASRASDATFYSPAQDMINYVQKTSSHLLDTNIYTSTPSEEVDKAWDDLYQYGIVKVTESENRLMLNSSLPIPGDEGNYIVVLDFYHQLHCLNMIRKALYPDYYGTEFNKTILLADTRIPLDPNTDQQEPLPTVPFHHISHCFNSIRESLMCSGDITPVIWSWDDRVHRSFPRFDVVHQCRDSDAIDAWVRERHMEEHFDVSVHPK